MITKQVLSQGASPALHKGHGGGWVKKAEHWIVRGGSLTLSIVSAHTVYWFFSAMDGVDRIEQYMTILTALAIGLLGYVILRGLTYRLLHGEKIYVYIPLCFILIGVETVSNFMKAIVGVHDDRWLAFCPVIFVQPMTIATYVVLSIIPAFTVFLAYVDMDLERSTSLSGATVSLVKGKVAPMSAVPASPVASPKPLPPTQKFPLQSNGGQQHPFSSIPPYPGSGQQGVQQQLPTPANVTAQIPPQGPFGGRMNNAGRFSQAQVPVNAQSVHP